MIRKFWCIRQNPSANTIQSQMRNFILSYNVVTCPFGHSHQERNNVLDGIYNEHDLYWKSRSQDRLFIEQINVDDIIIIPFAKLRTSIVAKVVSTPVYCIHTTLFTSQYNGKIQLSDKGDTPFRPIGRKIQIIDDYFLLHDKRKLSMRSLCNINPIIFDSIKHKIKY